MGLGRFLAGFEGPQWVWALSEVVSYALSTRYLSPWRFAIWAIEGVRTSYSGAQQAEG